MGIFSEDPGSYAHEVLWSQGIQNERVQLGDGQTAQFSVHGGIALTLREHFDESAFDLALDLSASECKDLRHGGDIPGGVGSEAPSDFTNAVDEGLALEPVVGGGESEEESLDDDVDVLTVTHAMENVKGLEMKKSMLAHKFMTLIS